MKNKTEIIGKIVLNTLAANEHKECEEHIKKVDKLVANKISVALNVLEIVEESSAESGKSMKIEMEKLYDSEMEGINEVDEYSEDAIYKSEWRYALREVYEVAFGENLLYR